MSEFCIIPTFSFGSNVFSFLSRTSDNSFSEKNPWLYYNSASSFLLTSSLFWGVSFNYSVFSIMLIIYAVVFCMHPVVQYMLSNFNSLNAELNPFCHLLALLGAHHILHVGRTRVKDWSVYKISPFV
jgi:hypothetical protein